MLAETTRFRLLADSHSRLKMGGFNLLVIIGLSLIGDLLVRCDPLESTTISHIDETTTSLSVPLSPLDLESKCESIRLKPEPCKGTYPDEAMYPKYERMLREIGAERNLPVPGTLIDKLWDNYIEDWTETLKNTSSSSGCSFLIAQFCLAPNLKSKQNRLETALTYAYFYRAKRNLQLNRIVEAFIDIMHAKHLRSKHRGVSIERIFNLEKSIRLEILHACQGDIERLLNVGSRDPRGKVELAYKRLDSLTDPSLGADPDARRGDVEVIREVIKIAFDLKMAYSR